MVIGAAGDHVNSPEEDAEHLVQWLLSAPQELAEHQRLSADLKMSPLLVAAGQGHVRIGFDIDSRFSNFKGFVHGGALSTVLDETASLAAMALVGRRFKGTVMMSTSFQSPAPLGRVIAEAKVSKRTRSLIFVDAEATDASGKLFAKSSVVAAYDGT